MYSKDQASALKQAFWTAFGQYMALESSAEGLKINWINYKTGIKHLHFKMQAGKRSACIFIEMSHPDTGIQQLMMEQFISYRNVLRASLEEEWEWNLHLQDQHYKTVSRISTSIEGVSIFKQEDWPTLISFFKPRMMALDAFWTDAQYGFELFR